jgi:hypothetical protein
MTLVAVTTRSRLRGVRFLPAMVIATLRVRRQLARTEGVVRWASVVAGPCEFWTLTVWSSRHAMQEFMRSDAHGEVMWRVAHWLRSFWLMRWRCGERELGAWDGLSFAQPERYERADELLARLAAIGGGGDVRAPGARAARGGGGVVRLPLRPRALAALVGLRRRLRRDDRLLRVAVGLGNRRDLYLFAVWSDAESARELVASAWAERTVRRFAGAAWIHEWRAESELGHWDGLRVRVRTRARAARGSAPAPPAVALPPSRAQGPRLRGP